MKIAWDAGNGAAGAVLRGLTGRLPGRHILLHDDVDGNFPAHPPDPTVDANLTDLIRTVRENGCDVGIAFDGDGDRIGVVDERGDILRCDILMTLYAREILAAHPGAAIIGDVKCSRVMFEEIERLGGRPVMWKTGHSLIKSKMTELGAKLAGELSGHIFFADRYYGFDDGLYCAIRLLNILGAGENCLSSLTAGLPRLHSTPEIRIEVAEEEKFALIEAVTAHLKATSAGEDVDTTDGVRVTDSNGWWLLRASNTQGAVTGRAEASSPEALERLKARIQDALARAGCAIRLLD